jgi:hypothetical protein
MEKAEVMLAGITEDIGRLAVIAERLERITVSHTMSIDNIDDIQRRLDELENRRKTVKARNTWLWPRH